MKVRFALLSAALAVGAALSLTACSPSPESVARDFYRAIGDGKPDKALDLVHPKSRAAGGAAAEKMVVAMSRQIASCGGIDQLSIDDGAKKRYLQLLRVKMVMKKAEESGCDNYWETIKVVNADGKWFLFFGLLEGSLIDVYISNRS